jgi:cytochrome c oxidase subunit 2
VGVLTWGLTIWAAVVYRRRKGQTGLPVQMRYNMPIEIFYTIVPLILVLGFFAFTAKDQAAIEARFDKPEVKVQVFGKQWAWDFNYLGGETEAGQPIEGGAYEQGVQAVDDPAGPQGSIDKDKLPTCRSTPRSSSSSTRVTPCTPSGSWTSSTRRTSSPARRTT